VRTGPLQFTVPAQPPERPPSTPPKAAPKAAREDARSPPSAVDPPEKKSRRKKKQADKDFEPVTKQGAKRLSLNMEMLGDPDPGEEASDASDDELRPVQTKVDELVQMAGGLAQQRQGVLEGAKRALKAIKEGEPAPMTTALSRPPGIGAAAAKDRPVLPLSPFVSPEKAPVWGTSDLVVRNTFIETRDATEHAEKRAALERGCVSLTEQNRQREVEEARRAFEDLPPNTPPHFPTRADGQWDLVDEPFRLQPQPKPTLRVHNTFIEMKDAEPPPNRRALSEREATRRAEADKMRAALLQLEEKEKKPPASPEPWHRAEEPGRKKRGKKQANLSAIDVDLPPQPPPIPTGGTVPESPWVPGYPETPDAVAGHDPAANAAYWHANAAYWHPYWTPYSGYGYYPPGGPLMPLAEGGEEGPIEEMAQSEPQSQDLLWLRGAEQYAEQYALYQQAQQQAQAQFIQASLDGGQAQLLGEGPPEAAEGEPDGRAGGIKEAKTLIRSCFLEAVGAKPRDGAQAPDAKEQRREALHELRTLFQELANELAPDPE